MKKLKLNSANELDRQIAECFIGSYVNFIGVVKSILVGITGNSTGYYFCSNEPSLDWETEIIIDLESPNLEFDPFTALKYDLSVSVALGLGRVITGKPNLPFGYYGTLTKEILINPSKVSLDLEYYKDLIIL